MRVNVLKQHMSILKCNAEDYRGALSHLEKHAAIAREERVEMHPALSELLAAYRNLLAITERSIQRVEESLS